MLVGYQIVTSAQRAMLARVIAAFAFRYGCFAVMTVLVLWAEARKAPTLPDLVLAHVPYVEWISRWNYVIWLLAYVPVALVLLARAPARFVRYMVTSGILSVVRGLCIVATGLGPVRGADVNAGMTAAERWHAVGEILNPISVFADGSAHVYLTKDLFFSGHVATTFLLLLYVWPLPRLRAAMILLHVVVVASVFLAHLHYTIDVIGAYAVAFSLFVLREGQPAAGLSPRALGPRWSMLGSGP